MSTRDQITETEVRMAVLNNTYHNEVSKSAFMEVMATNTSMPAEQADLAWEIIDYLEWQNED